MSAYSYSLVQILAEHGDKPDDPEDCELIEQVASAIYERYEDLPEMDQWPQSVQYFFACYDLNFQVGAGGFAQAAYNVPELFLIAEQAFQFLKRPAAAELCRRANSMLPAELKTHLEKGFTEEPSIGDVFEHFDESPMADLDEEIPDEFWVGVELQQLVRQHRADFESMETPTAI